MPAIVRRDLARARRVAKDDPASLVVAVGPAEGTGAGRRADFLGDGDVKEQLEGDLREMQTLVKRGLALAREYDGIGPGGTAPGDVEVAQEPS